MGTVDGAVDDETSGLAGGFLKPGIQLWEERCTIAFAVVVDGLAGQHLGQSRGS